MSSFFGHSIAAIAVYLATEPKMTSQSLSIFTCPNYFQKNQKQLLWILWLVVIASIPDLDYVVEAWKSSNNQGLRTTHSILFSLIVPGLTIVVLFLQGVKGKKLLLPSAQVVLSGLSHLILDISVGVTPLPLLFPAINISFKLPFGILPSAGKIDLNNYYFYRNLKLEMGVLLPIFRLVLLWRDRSINSLQGFPTKYLIKIFVSTFLLMCCGYFIRLNLPLPR